MPEGEVGGWQGIDDSTLLHFVTVRVGIILEIEFEDKSNWLVVRLEEIETVRVKTQLIM